MTRSGGGLVDLRLLPAALAGWAVATWAVVGPPRVVLGVGAGLGVAAVLLLWWAGRRPWGSSLAVVVAVSGFVLLTTAVRASGTDELASSASEHLSVVVTGRVTTDATALTAGKGPARSTYRVTVDSVRRPYERTARISRGSVQVFAATTVEDAPVVGARIELTGRLAPSDPGSRADGVLFVTRAAAPVAPPDLPHRLAQGLRDGLRTACAGLAPDARGLVPGMVTGDTAGVTTDLSQAMRASGLTHLTAVSGTNVTIVCGSVVLLLGLTRVGVGGQVLGGGVALVAFVLVATPQPSVVRAAAMGAVGLLGAAQGRRGAGVSALSAAVVTLCVVDPWLAREWGFILSVAATASLVLIGPPLTRLLARVMPTWCAAALAVPLAAQILCGPVLVLARPVVAVYSVPANLLADVAVAPTTVFGCLALLVQPVCPAAATAFAWVAGLGARWIATVARTTAHLPGAQVIWPSGGAGALLLLGAGVLVLAGIAAAVEADRRWRLRHRLWRRVHGWSPRRRTAVAGALVGVVVLVVVVVRWRTPPWPAVGWRVVACDVGQGDGMAVSTGAGHAMVIDAGGDPGPMRSCLDRLHVRTVDLLVLTHFHADHVGGLSGVLTGRTVNAALVSPLAAPSGEAAATLRALKDAGVTPQVGTKGMSGRVADVRFTVISPASTQGVAYADPNDASVALILTMPGLTLAALGDLEPPSQTLVGEVPVVDVVKVAHHGSRYQNPDLYRRLAPRLALVSVGAGNDYGHPAPATVRFLQDDAAMVARTDELGDIAVGTGEGGVLWTRGRG